MDDDDKTVNALWTQFQQTGSMVPPTETVFEAASPPRIGPLTITTQTKEYHVNATDLDLSALFWHMPVITYWHPTEGLVKKEIKVIHTTQDMLTAHLLTMQSYPSYTEHIITHLDLTSSDVNYCNPCPRYGTTKRKPHVLFLDVRKLSAGLCKKDIMTAKCKPKKVFNNCLTLNVRVWDEQQEEFREYHVKVFRTGKLEIPGLQSDHLVARLHTQLLGLLRPLYPSIAFTDEVTRVLINSGFSCSFYIDQFVMKTVLKQHYQVESSMDQSNYQGMKVAFYFPKHSQQLGCHHHVEGGGSPSLFSKVTLVVFRTGKCLINGNASEQHIHYVYDFAKKVLTLHPETRNQSAPPTLKKDGAEKKQKVEAVKKKRKRMIAFPAAEE